MCGFSLVQYAGDLHVRIGGVTTPGPAAGIAGLVQGAIILSLNGDDMSTKSVGQVAALGILHILQQAAGGADGQIQVVATETL